MIQGIIDILINDAGVRAEVGRNKLSNKWKVYPVVSPQEEDDPYIVLTITKADITQGKGCDANLDYVKVDVYNYAKTYAKADALHNAVRDAIIQYSGVRLGYSYSDIQLDDYRDGWTDLAKLYVKVATYLVTVSRVIPT